MISPLSFGALAGALFAGAALATPTATTSSAALAYTNAPTFSLISEQFTGVGGVSYVGNWSLVGYHTGAGLNTAVLVSPSTEGYGQQFYANGSRGDFYTNSSNVLTTGGTPPSPWGLIIPSAADSTSDPLGRRVQVNAGLGTPGVQIGFIKTPADTYPVPYLEYASSEPGPGTFYACNTTYFPGQPEVPVVFWHNASVSTPLECIDIRLYPQCDGNFTEPANRPFAVRSECFPSVDAWETEG